MITFVFQTVYDKMKNFISILNPNNYIYIYEKCAQRNKYLYIKNLYICSKCKKIVCRDCILHLSRNTAEVNFKYHYLCFDKNIHEKPGKFSKILKL